MIVDTSALFAFFVRSDPAHSEVVDFFSDAGAEPLIVSPLVVAELEYLIVSRFGIDAESDVLRELSSGAWVLAPLVAEDLAETASLVEKYRGQDIGATDASLVVLAARHGTHTIATLDRRHFGVLRAMDGKRFRLVPAL